ncbi:MAG: hypothetical protein KC486_30190 [Myxococcales bacterium]|nr:hypothetical protein [Myxococcales bacterium]
MVDVGPAELRDAAAKRAAMVRDELDRLQEGIDRHHDDVRRLRRELGQAWEALTDALVPDLDGARLDRLSARLEAPSLAAASVHAAIEADRRELERGVADLEAERARRGDSAALAERLREIKAEMAPHAEVIDLFEREHAWRELFDLGYGSAGYPLRWWQFRYYRHRRHADELLASLGPQVGAATFAELRERYLAEREARAALAREWESCTTRKSALDNLDRGLRVALAARDAVAERHLAGVRRSVRKRLHKLPPDELAERFTDLPEVHRAALHIAGLDAKRRALERIVHAWIERPRTELLELLNGDERDLVELARDGCERAMPWELFVDAYPDLRPRWSERWRIFERCRGALLGFDDYASRTAGMSWWQVMVGVDPPPPPVDGD